MQITEIAPYKSEVRVVYNVTFGILVLIETQQASAVSKTRKYFAGMSSPAEGNVYIRPVRGNVHGIYAFLQQYRYMICYFFFSHFTSLFVVHRSSFIISSRAAPNASGAIKGISVRSLAHISILLSTPIKRTSLCIPAICR